VWSLMIAAPANVNPAGREAAEPIGPAT
jgi:hypothetical protein